MIVITGAAGFIASYLAEVLNQQGRSDLILVDDFTTNAKRSNWVNLRFEQCLDREAFLPWFEENIKFIDLVFHLGARTDTTEKSQEILDHLNLNYSKAIWKICSKAQIPLVYASSAATYGLGEFGYKDEHHLSTQLQPLNLYGKSKNDLIFGYCNKATLHPVGMGSNFLTSTGQKSTTKDEWRVWSYTPSTKYKKRGKCNSFDRTTPNTKTANNSAISFMSKTWLKFVCSYKTTNLKVAFTI